MSGLRPPPTGHQFRFFLLDLLTDRSMAHAILFREGFLDIVNFSLRHVFQSFIAKAVLMITA